MTINTLNNVGIGKTNPARALDVESSSKKSSEYSCVLRSMSTDPSESFTSVSESNTSNCVCVCILIFFVFYSFAYMRMDWTALAYIKLDLNKKRFM